MTLTFDRFPGQSPVLAPVIAPLFHFPQCNKFWLRRWQFETCSLDSILMSSDGRATECLVHECLVTECLVTECLYIWMPNWMQEISHNMLSSSFPGQIASASSTGAIRKKLYRQHLSNNQRPKLPKTLKISCQLTFLTNSARRLMEENSLYIRNMLMVSHSLFS